mmetsp:Transcript_7211/g.22216  ORF Transcript_7211/g.22216 Transcript_7211/m.22216 type:complete len:209 (+) Transcript_7211:174-800(+)
MAEQTGGRARRPDDDLRRRKLEVGGLGLGVDRVCGLGAAGGGPPHFDVAGRFVVLRGHELDVLEGEERSALLPEQHEPGDGDHEEGGDAGGDGDDGERSGRGGLGARFVGGLRRREGRGREDAVVLVPRDLVVEFGGGDEVEVLVSVEVGGADGLGAVGCRRDDVRRERRGGHAVVFVPSNRIVGVGRGRDVEVVVAVDVRRGDGAGP